MRRHCPSCTRDLGRNEALEHFPVGTRLAFDAARGRLWALCPRCRAWSLAPIEERWEAVEEAERLFERAEEGLATENIALGRLRDGTELVRIGKAEGPELAGWRYANRIRKRWKRAQTVGAVGTTAWVIGGPTTLGSALLPLVLLGAAGYGGWQYLQKRDRRLEFDANGGGEGPPRRIRLVRRQLRQLRLLADGEDAWSLEVRPPNGSPIVIPPGLRSRALRLSLLELNTQLGAPAHLEKALDRVTAAGEPGRLAALAARDLAQGKFWESHLGWPWGDPHALARADPVLRLALEIAANEEAEQIALEGELYRLELEWQEAEELAAISDDLLVPSWVRRRIRALRKGSPPAQT